jgi:Phage integrase family
MRADSAAGPYSRRIGSHSAEWVSDSAIPAPYSAGQLAGPYMSTCAIRGHRCVASAMPFPTISTALLGELTAAKNRHAVEILALGEAYTDRGYVVCNEAGQRYHPSTLSTMWQSAIRDLDVPQIRLHDARHTCATLMHLQGVPIALVAAWLGHADVSFTLRTYVHAQPDALELAARSLLPRPPTPGTDGIAHACGDTQQDPVTICDNFGLTEHSCD